jgi:hypothetical protein
LSGWNLAAEIRGDAENQRRRDDQQPDAQQARDHRNEQPIAQVGDEIALAPPRLARIAGPEPGQHGENNREPDRDRQVFGERFADHADEGGELLQHPG